MKRLSAAALFAVPLGMLLSLRAMAQATTVSAPSAAPVSPEAPLYDPAQLPSFTGRLQQFTLSPRGDIDGMIMSDGTEVKTPPHLSTAIAYTVRPGDTLLIHGLRAAAIPLIQAVSITDRANGRTILDTDAGAGGPRPGPARGVGYQWVEAQGEVRMSLHGPRGEINGVPLTDGTVLRLPPDAAFDLASLLEPGKPLVAQGNEVSNAVGWVLDVSEIGPSREQLNDVAPPPPPGPRGRRGPPPPPPGAPR